MSAKIIRRVGRYTKQETAELTRMFGEGYSVYKICRNLNRSQNSIRNNLIRLGLIEGEISPIRISKSKNNQSSHEITRISILKYVWYSVFILILSLVFVINPHLNILDTLLFYVFNITLAF